MRVKYSILLGFLVGLAALAACGTATKTVTAPASSTPVSYTGSWVYGTSASAKYAVLMLQARPDGTCTGRLAMHQGKSSQTLDYPNGSVTEEGLQLSGTAAGKATTLMLQPVDADHMSADLTYVGDTWHITFARE